MNYPDSGTVICCSELLAQYIQQIFILMFQRLQSSKTTKCVKCKLKLLADFLCELSLLCLFVHMSVNLVKHRKLDLFEHLSHCSTGARSPRVELTL